MLKRSKRFLSRLSRARLRAGHLLLHDPWKLVMVVRMAWWVLLVSVGVRLLTLPRLLRLTLPQRPIAASVDDEVLEAEMSRLIDAVLSLNLFVFKPVCWKRAIVLQRYLALYGIRTRIAFGVRGAEGQALTGHAWLEAGNGPLLESRRPDYIVTYVYPD